MSGPYDRNDAILAIHAGAGGTDAQDRAEMVLRMYLRWAERRGWEAELLDKVDGEEAGSKSATVLVKGPYAYGYLKAEKGGPPAGPHLPLRCGSPPPHLVRPG